MNKSKNSRELVEEYRCGIEHQSDYRGQKQKHIGYSRVFDERGQFVALLKSFRWMHLRNRHPQLADVETNAPAVALWFIYRAHSE